MKSAAPGGIVVLVKRLLVAATITALAVLAASGASGAPSASQPFVTGIFDPIVFGSPDRDQGFAMTKAAGGTVVRLLIDWGDVAPETRKPGFDPRNPTDPQYRWDEVDGEVRRADKLGLAVILNIYNAPNWASQGYTKLDLGPIEPDPGEYGNFSYAAALRFSGKVAGLPRVRYWQAWNEPNLGLFLMPQKSGGNDASPDLYRALVNAFAASVHAASADNLVVAGALAPFSSDADFSVSPLKFMRELLCVGAGPKPAATCNARTSFDVWSTHPYTSGGPNHKASDPDGGSLGNLPDMRAVLDAAVRLGHIDTGRKVGFWVTEFSWDSKPSDPEGVPDLTLTRWVAEAFYRMWSNGVSLVTWFTIRDNPFPDSFYQSGLYTTGAAPKPMVKAFQFPFVAFNDRGRAVVWGRTPGAKAGNVTIERRAGTIWVKVATLRASSVGIFSQTLTPKPKATNTSVYRARFGSSIAPPFSLGPTPDMAVKPFGVYNPQ